VEGVRFELDRAHSPAATIELLERLGILGSGADAPRLEQHADSGHAAVRSAALTALARIGDQRSLDLLLGYVHSQDEELSRPAIAALGRVESDRAMDELRHLAGDADAVRRSTAWRALALRGGSEPRAILHRIARTCPPNDVWSAVAAVATLGEEVDQRLLLVLARSGRGRRSSAALGALSQSPGPAVADALIALAEEPSHLRVEALAALGGLEDPRAVGVLEEAGRARPSDRRVVIQALGRSRAPGAVEALVGLAEEASQEEVVLVFAALARRQEPEVGDLLRTMAREDSALGGEARSALAIRNDPQATALLVEAFDEDGTLPPAAALEHLAIHGGEAGWSLLEEALATGGTELRSGVVWALEKRGDADATDRLLHLARNDGRAVSSMAAAALEQMGDRARTGLRDILVERVTEGTAVDHGQSLQLLARLGGEGVVELLEGRMREGTSSERRQALAALARVEDPSAVEAVRSLYRESEDPVMRAEAVNHLVWGGSLDDEMLDAALQDKDPSVVVTVATALAHRGGEDSKARLLKLVDADALQVRSTALSSLAQLGGEDADAALVLGLQDEELAPRIMWSAATSSSPKVLEAVRDVARSASPELRSNAIGALSSDPHPGTMDLLTEALRDADSGVAESALLALRGRGSSSAAEAIGGLLDDLPEEDGLARLRYDAAHALQAMGGSAAEERAGEIERVLASPGPMSGVVFGVGVDSLGSGLGLFGSSGPSH
jgi:HEAT repeat protein